MPEHTNRLIHESSPYLRQHAHNPVDWQPWDAAALEEARSTHKPILLSIGYSACHWCHVMEHESFEDESTARLMNEHFVCIKVDREERPDIDQIYMNAVQMLTGHGGWPLTVFLTPEGNPFYGGTYFPPEDRYGMPGFRRLLLTIANAYREQADDVGKAVAQILTGLQRAGTFSAADEMPDAEMVLSSAANLSRAYDEQHGGIGQAPKFPNVPVFELFLRAYRATNQPHYLDMVTHTLSKMARGGIYDQLGGGFHRYSVDQQWLVPHFEKMLYDQAQLVLLYLAAYQLTGELFFATIARETLDYVARELRDRKSGGFFSSQDADSEGHEGRYYVWHEAEVREILGDELAPIAGHYWDISAAGNFEGHNILHVTSEIENLAETFTRDVGDLRLLLGEARAKLFARRARRPRPDRDDKMLTSWNALMISAFAKATELFGEDTDRKIMLEATAFLRQHLQRGDRLLRVFQDGAARLNGYLDDYAFAIAALLDVFETIQDRQYLDEAVTLADAMLAHFWDSESGGFFFTSDDHEALIVRSKPALDAAIPSGNSKAVQDLLRLYHYTGNLTYLDRAEAAGRLFAGAAREQPVGFANMLCALDFSVHHPFELVIAGDPAAAETEMLLDQIRRLYLPNRTLQIVDPAAPTSLPPMLQDKVQIDGQPTVYLCHHMACAAPTTNWFELEPLLRRGSDE